MTDFNIDINYAKENEEFDMNSMKDDLISVEEEEEHRILFRYLPGIFVNGQYFQNSQIHLVTYKINNPNKFHFEKPIFNDSKAMIGNYNQTILESIDNQY